MWNLQSELKNSSDNDKDKSYNVVKQIAYENIETIQRI